MKDLLKKIVLFTLLVSLIYPSASFTGLTGGIDFPSAYILRNRNYTISGIFSSLNEEIVGDFVIETGLIPQVEAGLKISTLNGKIDQSFLQANMKFQIVSEGRDNPAIAIGFTEFDTYSIQGSPEEDRWDNSEAYAFLVMSKGMKIRGSSYEGSFGVMYSQSDEGGNANIFGIMDLPVFEKIRILAEGYSYDVGNKKRGSINLGAEFVTRDNFRTKVYWRERNDSFGVSVHYIGLFNAN